MILNKVGFDSRISNFFASYLINRHTHYVWNHFISLYFKANIGVGQKFVLFPIFSAPYITPMFYIFEKKTKNLLTPIPVLILSFVNDGLLISQEKSYEKSNMTLFYSYSIFST